MFLFRNGVSHAGEIHFVHINPETKDLAVLGIFMNVIRDKDANSSSLDTTSPTIAEWEKYFEAAANLTKSNMSTVVNLNLSLLIGNNLNDFWRYKGSLTVPPCSEVVTWTVFKTPITFTESQLNFVRENVVIKNYRGPQPLYNRMVYRSYPRETGSTVPDYNYCPNILSNTQRVSVSFNIFLVSIAFLRFFSI